MHSQEIKQGVERKIRWTWLFALTGLTFLVYLNTLSHEFLINWDDPKYVLENTLIRGFNLKNLTGIFTTQFVGNYAPLNILSYSLDYTLWGLKPLGYHLTNVLLHTVNSILVYLFLFRFCRHRWASFIGALVFSVHPVQAESVAWVSERKNILSMFFFLLSFLSYLRFRDTGRRPHYYVSFMFFFCALMTKSVTVILPPILFAYELISGNSREKAHRILGRLWPFLLAAAATAVLTIITQTHESGIRGFYGGTVYANFLTALVIHLRYLHVLLFPINLSALYEVSIPYRLASPDVIAAIMTLGITGFLFYRLFAVRSFASFWIGFYFIALLPVSHIVPITTPMNDRYLYFPMVAVAGAISHIVVYFEKIRKNSPFHGLVAGVTVFLLISTLAAGDYNRNRVWENSLVLWLDTVAKAPNDAKAHGGLGEIYMRMNRFQEAERELSKSIELDPMKIETRINLGNTCSQLGKLQDAVLHLEEAVRLAPEYGVARSDLAWVYWKQGRLDEASIQFSKAVELDPENTGIKYNLAVFYTQTKRVREAAEVLEAALRLEPDHVHALVLITSVYAELGQERKIEDLYFSAIEKAPHNPLLSYNLACFYATHEKPDQALVQLRDALRKGMTDVRLLEEDPDLEVLRSRPDFRALVKEISPSPVPSR